MLVLPAFHPSSFFSSYISFLISSILPQVSVFTATFLSDGHILGASMSKWNILYVCIRNLGSLCPFTFYYLRRYKLELDGQFINPAHTFFFLLQRTF